MNPFFKSEFSFYPLVWMCGNTKINRLHEGCLRMVYDDKNLTFNELLEKDGCASI